MGDRMMRVLAIDTATDAVVTGIVEFDKRAAWPTTVAERTVIDGRRHAEVLTTVIGEVFADAGLARSAVDAVVVGCGPGPFTGLRVGMATGAAYGDAIDVPVYGVCSLDALAAQHVSTHPEDHGVLVVSDARRREIYWARYVDGRRVSGPDVAAPDLVVAETADIEIDAVLGSASHTALFDRRIGDIVMPSAAGLVYSAREEIGVTTPEPLVPLYLRRPDAKEPKPRQRAAPASSGGAR